jgi:hypothetical protein
MNKGQLQNEILAIIKTVFEDKKALQKIHSFLLAEIYEEPEPEEMPKRYKEVVSKIADSLLAGLICFFNPETFEVEDIPKELAYDLGEFELMIGETYESAGLKHENWQNCITIEPMESHDSFQIMECFIDEVKETNLQGRLVNALNRKNPFANFKYLVESSKYRQHWFDFRQVQYELYVWDAIKTNIEFES